MDTVSTVFIIVGALMVLLAGLKVADPPPISLGWFGLALWMIGMSINVVVSVAVK